MEVRGRNKGNAQKNHNLMRDFHDQPSPPSRNNTPVGACTCAWGRSGRGCFSVQGPRAKKKGLEATPRPDPAMLVPAVLALDPGSLSLELAQVVDPSLADLALAYHLNAVNGR